MFTRKKGRLATDNVGYLMIAPFILFFFFFILLPLIMTFLLSFTSYNLLIMKFVGLRNYFDLFSDFFFIQAIKNTGIYTFFTLIITIVLSLIIATILNEEVFFRKVFRTVYFLPHITSMVAVSLIWLWMFEPSQGTFNRILTLLGIQRINWLDETKWALPSLIFMAVWKTIGYNIVIFLAGLQTIPEYLYEAATIDGASKLQKFFHITIPLLAPVTFFLFVTGLIFNFNVFEQVLIMTDGGPSNSTTTIVHQVYLRAFSEFFMGYASAISCVATAIVLVITLINFKYGSKKTDIGMG